MSNESCKRPKKKIAILTNLISPYRVPLFSQLAAKFSVVVAIGIQETNRPEWNRVDPELVGAGVQVKELKGLLIRRSEDNFLHINPGYLPFLMREKPDGVISFELGFRTLVALFYAKISHTPLWIWSEGTVVSDGQIRAFKLTIRKFLARSNVRWLTLGSSSSEYLESIGVDRSRIVQLQNGVDERKYTAQGPKAPVDSPCPLILVVGQLIERKGLERLFASAKRLQDRGEVFSLRLIGSGPRRKSLEDLVETLGLQNVEFMGGLPAEEIPAHYRAADVLMFPTLTDVWGLVVNEALLCGTPVICSKYAGCAADLLDKDEIFDPLNSDELDAALLRAVRGQAKRPVHHAVWPMGRIVGTLSQDVESVVYLRDP